MKKCFNHALEPKADPNCPECYALNNWAREEAARLVGRETSDGTSADYYKVPPGSTELQHLISHRNMNAQIGEIFRSCYRYGMSSHSDQLRDAKKIQFYINAEIERLEKMHGTK